MTNRLHPIGNVSPAVSSVLRTVLGGAVEGIIVEDQEKRIVALNSAILEIFELENMSPKTFLGKSLLHFEQMSPRLISKRSPLVNEEDQIDKDGSHLSEIISFQDGSEFTRHHLPIIEGGQLTGHLWLYGDANLKSLRNVNDKSASFNLPESGVLDRTSNQIWTRSKLISALLSAQVDTPIQIFLLKVREISELVEAIGILKVSTFINYLITDLNSSFISKSAVRINSDEILFLASGTDFQSSTLHLEEIRTKICKLSEIYFQIEIAVGAANFTNNDSADVENALNQAHIALAASMHLNKEILYNPQISDSEFRREEIIASLPRAVNDRAFQLAIQPIVDLKTMQTLGYEALSRWNHATIGYVTAEEYIPIASELNYLTLIDQSNFEIVLKYGHKVLDKNLRGIGLNISPSYLEPKRKLVETLEDFLAKFSASPDQLVLEITESELMSNFDDAVGTLNRVSALGVGIAIDDFGVGNSSLSVLQNIPFNYLKLDKSFANTLNDERTQVVIKTVSKIGETFGVKTIAEGVEREDQVEILRDLNIDAGQGWFFGHPVPLND